MRHFIAHIQNQDTVMAIMQKNTMNYSLFVKLSLKVSVCFKDACFRSYRFFFKFAYLTLLALFVSGCAHQGEHRIDLNNLDRSSKQVVEKTDLMLAAESGNSNALKTALEQGGKINAITATDTAFSLALKNRHEAISRILLSAGSDWEKGFDEQQTSALIMAADEGFDNIVKMLILKGAPLEAKNEKGYTALAISAKNGHLTTLKILINAGANVNVNPEGRSVLMHVVEKNNMLLSQLLIGAEADLNYSDSTGDTALKIARRNGFYDLDLMLVQAGARP